MAKNDHVHPLANDRIYSDSVSRIELSVNRIEAKSNIVGNFCEAFKIFKGFDNLGPSMFFDPSIGRKQEVKVKREF